MLKYIDTIPLVIDFSLPHSDSVYAGIASDPGQKLNPFLQLHRAVDLAHFQSLHPEPSLR
jgi:hypothetical protein